MCVLNWAKNEADEQQEALRSVLLLLLNSKATTERNCTFFVGVCLLWTLVLQAREVADCMLGKSPNKWILDTGHSLMKKLQNPLKRILEENENITVSTRATLVKWKHIQNNKLFDKKLNITLKTVELQTIWTVSSNMTIRALKVWQECSEKAQL